MIFQLTETQFTQTRRNSSYFSQIRSNFGIDWNATTYQDLQKPLYSALAAWMTILRHRTSIPRDVDGQAHLWQNVFDDRGTKMMFMKSANQLDQGKVE